MDRVTFSESISDDPVSLVTKYFNELMGVYDLFGHCKNISIEKSDTQDQPISFWITFDSNLNAEEMNRIAANKELCLYGTLYKFTGSVDGNAVKIQVYK